MAKLTAKARKALPSKSFAIPGKKAYPINDRAHAANALARVAQHGTPSEQARVKAAVHKKYPGMGSGGSSSGGGKGKAGGKRR